MQHLQGIGMKNKAVTRRILLLSLVLVMLPVEPSESARVSETGPVISIEIDNNIAVVEGKVASTQQAVEAEKLIFAASEFDWIENKLKVDPGVEDYDLSGLIAAELADLTDPDRYLSRLKALLRRTHSTKYFPGPVLQEQSSSRG